MKHNWLRFLFRSFMLVEHIRKVENDIPIKEKIENDTPNPKRERLKLYIGAKNGNECTNWFWL